MNYTLILADIATFIALCLPPISGALYIAGSVVYWPSIKNVSPSAGGLLFTVGSILLVLVDFAFAYLEPEFSLFKPFSNAGSFKSFCQFIGNLAFTVGSVYFLPGLPILIGEDFFIAGSILNFIPQIVCIWSVTSLNIFTAPFYTKMINYRKTIVLMNICLGFGCFCFIVGTYLFQNSKQESEELNEEGALLFIVGSICYLITPLIGLKMRKKKNLDPLANYHKQIYKNFLSKKTISYQSRKIIQKMQSQYIVLQIEPSVK